MSEVIRLGLDIAKNVFQVHGVNAAEEVVVQRSLRRGRLLAFFATLPPCLIGIEACATAHYWARALTGLGHTVKLIPPAYAKPYVRRNKNDAADAAEIARQAEWHPEFGWLPLVVDGERPRMVVWLETVEVRREGHWWDSFRGGLSYTTIQVRLPEGGEGLLRGRVRAES